MKIPVTAKEAQRFIDENLVDEEVSLTISRREEGGKKFLTLKICNPVTSFSADCEAMNDCVSFYDGTLMDGTHNLTLGSVVLTDTGLTLYSPNGKATVRFTTKPLHRCRATSLFSYQIPWSDAAELGADMQLAA